MNLDGVRETIGILAVLMTGPLLGVEFGIAAFTNPLLSRLPDDAFWRARGDGGKLLGFVMPFWYIGAQIALSLAAAVTPTGCLLAAALLMGLALVLSVAVLVPINNRIGRWQSVSDVSRPLARRWDRLHGVRVAILAGVFALSVLGLGAGVC